MLLLANLKILLLGIFLVLLSIGHQLVERNGESVLTLVKTSSILR